MCSHPGDATAPAVDRSPAVGLVGRSELEAKLETAAATVADPKVGLYGPDSILWEVNREALMFLGGGRAALLQLAHPYVAEAIDQHSNTRSDPFGRFRRTFTNVFAMVYGDLDAALAAARRVHGVHRKISGAFAETTGAYRLGTRYQANEPHALLWVHSTLWETSVHVFERTVRPLSCAEKEDYYQQTKLFAYLFGLGDEHLPPSWDAFLDYNHRMWRSGLAVGRNAREIGGFLFQPHLPGSKPLMAWLRLMTAGLMPEGLREDFGLDFSARHQRIYRSSLRFLRISRRFWPRRLRYVPPYIAALRRIAGNHRRDRLGEALMRLWLGDGAVQATTKS